MPDNHVAGKGGGGKIVVVIPAVMAVVAVITHDEVFILAQRKGCHAEAVIVALRGQVGFVQRFAIAVDHVGANLDHVSGNAHHALDEVLRAAGILADDHISALRVAKEVFRLGYQHDFAVLQGVAHAFPVYADGFKQECTNQQRGRHRHRNGQNPAQDFLFDVERLFFFAGLAGSSALHLRHLFFLDLHG